MSETNIWLIRLQFVFRLFLKLVLTPTPQDELKEDCEPVFYRMNHSPKIISKMLSALIGLIFKKKNQFTVSYSV